MGQIFDGFVVEQVGSLEKKIGPEHKEILCKIWWNKKRKDDLVVMAINQLQIHHSNKKKSGQ